MSSSTEESLAKYTRTRKAVSETIRICKEADILREYLEEREQEVSNIMMTLFDEETIRKNHEASVAREYTEKSIKRMVKFYQSKGDSRADAVEAITQCFELEPEVAAKKVDLYWLKES